jgi:outer membrane receptor protein involved in Fe transport
VVTSAQQFVSIPLEGQFMKIHARHLRAALLTSALVSTMAFAVGRSVITGTVTDAASGKPVADVVITATSPALQGEETVVTDDSGSYTIPQLPSGSFVIRAEKEGFKPLKRDDVKIGLDRNVRLNLQVQPESLQSDTIVVVGKAPVVDIGSTNTGVDVSKDFINNIAFVQPNGNGIRTFDSLASVAPQVSGDTYGNGFSGSQSPENLYVVDGVSVGDPAFGTNGGAFPIEFVNSANVITGGYQAEYGRSTGGVLAVETKSGSNEFHGSLWGNLTPGILSGKPTEIRNDASSIVVATVGNGAARPWNTADIGAEIGGPIIKDKLWFFAGVSPSWVRAQESRKLRRFLLNDTKTDFQYDKDGNVISEDLPGTTTTRFNDTRAISYIAKLTYAINSNHSVSLSANGSPSFNRGSGGNLNPRKVPGWDGQFDTPANTSSVALRYQGGFFDKALLADVTLGWFHIDNGGLPSDGSQVGNAPGVGATGYSNVVLRRSRPYSINDAETLAPDVASLCEAPGTVGRPSVIVRGASRDVFACPITGNGAVYGFGGPGQVTETALERFQVRGSLSYLLQALGHHTFKAGVDIENLRYDINKGVGGGVSLQESTRGTNYFDNRQYGTLTGPDQYIQTTSFRSTPTAWGIGAFVQDSWSIMDVVTLNAGLRYDTQQLFAGSGELGLTLNNMLSPRIGLIYDFTQQGRSKIFANFARFYESVPIDIADRSLTGENQFGFFRRNSGPDGCNPLRDINEVFSNCRASNNYFAGAASENNAISQNGNNTGAGKVPVDSNLKPQGTDEIAAGAEYEIISNGRVGASYTKRWLINVIEDLSFDNGTTYIIGNPGYGLAPNFPKAQRDYDAVTAYFTKGFSDGWLAQVSYTWSSLRGNYNGLFRPENGQLDPNINSDFDLIALLPNRVGPLDADRTHFIKGFASKQFQVTNEFGFNIGLTYTGSSGQPINYLASYPRYGPGESYVLPRGSGGRRPWVHTVNAKVGLNYRLSKDNMIEVSADVFNVFNFQAATTVSQAISGLNIIPYSVAPGKDPATSICLAGTNVPGCENGQTPLKTVEGNDVAQSDFNPNFKNPTAYQSPISVRFGVKFTF